ncbi:DUF5673 domain-containing protein [Candidatus Latescibacterota bacterium]
MYWFIIIMAAVVAISVGIIYRLSIREVDKKTAWKEFRLGVTIIGFVIIISVGYLFMPHDPLMDTIMPYLKVLIYAVLLLNLAGWIRNLKQGGAVLLDLGKSIQKKIIMVAGCMFILNGIIATIGLYVDSKSTIDSRCIIDLPVWYIILFIGGIFFVLSGLINNKIKEGGILFSDRFIRWGRITSYEWEGDLGLTLTLKIKHRFSLFQTLSIPVQDPHKDAVEQLLKQHVTDDQE